MAETIYTYSITTDFPNGRVNEPVLRIELLASAISSSLIRIARNDDVLDIVYDPALSTGDKTTLDGDVTGPAGGLIALHDADAEIIIQSEFVLDKDLSSPPGSPSIGDTYIVGSTATGAWLDKENRIARWNGSSWDFTKPEEGLIAWIVDENKHYYYTDAFPSGSWSILNTDTSDHGNLSGLSDDDHSQYHNDTRGDARYFQKTEHLNVSAGAGDSGKPIKLNSSGLIDTTMLPPFLSNYQYAESEGESTTTSGTLQTKLTLTTPNLTNGTYRIGYCFEISNGSNGVLSEVQVKVGATVISLSTFEADDDYHPHGGFKNMTVSGVTSITIKYRDITSGTAKIRNARLEIWRVS